MKMNNIKLYALLVAVLFVGACSDELEQGYGPVKIACDEEIQFGVVSGAVNDAKGTRTVYGDVNGDKIEVNWDGGDRLSIASPQAGGVADHVATYVVDGIQVGNEHKANRLVKVGDVALQWTDSEEYNFYAVYPSVVADKVEIELQDDNAYLKGSLPVSQSGEVIKDEETGDITIVPDMRNAFMTAKQYYNIKDENGNPRTDPVQLTFNSLCTAVQFELSAGDLVEMGENASFVEDKTVKIQSVTLSSAKRKTICGDFTYNYADGTVESSGDGSNDLSYVTIDFSDEVLLTFGDPETHKESHNNIADTHHLYQGSNSVNFTFFMLPVYEQSVNDGDLQLKIVFTVDGVIQTKTATVNSDIKASTKHFFGGMKLPMPTLGSSEDANTSNWFSILNNDIYFSQLSFVVAGNAFSSGSNASYKQQVMSYTDLWNFGVRGFEICTYNNSDNGSGSIGSSPIISGGASTGVTVEDALEKLYPKLGNETMVLVFTPRHMSTMGNFNPSVFVSQITNYLGGEFLNFVRTNKNKPELGIKDLFFKLESTSCVGDMKGKIAVIIRPGDNDYVKFTGKSEAATPEGWGDYISIIHDWGTGEDQWDDRYGSQYYANGGATWSNSGKSNFETGFMVSDNNDNKITQNKPAASRSYAKKINNTADAARVQCWERIVPQDSPDMKITGKRQILWGEEEKTYYVDWFESYVEKKEMFKSLLDDAKGYKGAMNSPLFINSLCGFFIDSTVDFSYVPECGKIGGSSILGGYSFSKSGTGGDFRSCAANLNYWLYNELKTSTTEGPYGVVMLDYIGATETHLNGFKDVESGVSLADAAKACQELPIMIMMNNFKFPMVTDPNYGNDNKTEKVELSQQPLDQGKDFLRWIEE